MAKNKLTVTKWTVMFLVSCVFAFEFVMLVKGIFGDRIVPRVIGFFLPPIF